MRVAVKIVLSDDEVVELSKLSKSRSVSVRLAERSKIVLLAGKGMTNEEIGKALGITRQKAGGMFGDPVSGSPVLIANALMAVVFIATMVELVLTLVFYRRGI